MYRVTCLPLLGGDRVCDGEDGDDGGEAWNAIHRRSVTRTSVLIMIALFMFKKGN